MCIFLYILSILSIYDCVMYTQLSVDTRFAFGFNFYKNGNIV